MSRIRSETDLEVEVLVANQTNNTDISKGYAEDFKAYKIHQGRYREHIQNQYGSTPMKSNDRKPKDNNK